ncbi:MAG: NAD(P)H-dependent oxidoreductase subunit E [Leptospirales bacterium]
MNSTSERTLPPAARAEADELLAEFPNKKSALLMILRIIEREFDMIDDAGLALAAKLCEVSPAHVLGMASFYTHFKRPWHGKHRLMVCATLMCALGGTSQALEQIHRTLGLRPGEITRDGVFSLEKVECLADCDRPPAMQVNFKHHVKMHGEALDRLLAELLAAEKKTPADYENQTPVKMNAAIPVVSVKQEM